MILPETLENPERASDAEVIAAYMREGSTEAQARAYLEVLRGNLPPDTTVD